MVLAQGCWRGPGLPLPAPEVPSSLPGSPGEGLAGGGGRGTFSGFGGARGPPPRCGVGRGSLGWPGKDRSQPVSCSPGGADQNVNGVLLEDPLPARRPCSGAAGDADFPIPTSLLPGREAERAWLILAPRRKPTRKSRLPEAKRLAMGMQGPVRGPGPCARQPCPGPRGVLSTPHMLGPLHAHRTLLRTPQVGISFPTPGCRSSEWAGACLESSRRERQCQDRPPGALKVRHQPTSLRSQSLSHVRLCELLDGSKPGSSVHGIFQARILECVAISSSRDLPDPVMEPISPVSPAWQMDSSPAEPSGKTHCLSQNFP